MSFTSEQLTYAALGLVFCLSVLGYFCSLIDDLARRHRQQRRNRY